jgi:hypothetical protein
MNTYNDSVIAYSIYELHDSGDLDPEISIPS